jgi:hypothetical protein
MEESIKGYVFGTAVLQFRGLDMKNVEPGLMGLGRSDPFFECEFSSLARPPLFRLVPFLTRERCHRTTNDNLT